MWKSPFLRKDLKIRPALVYPTTLGPILVLSLKRQLKIFLTSFNFFFFLHLGTYLVVFWKTRGETKIKFRRNGVHHVEEGEMRHRWRVNTKKTFFFYCIFLRRNSFFCFRLIFLLLFFFPFISSFYFKHSRGEIEGKKIFNNEKKWLRWLDTRGGTTLLKVILLFWRSERMLF